MSFISTLISGFGRLLVIGVIVAIVIVIGLKMPRVRKIVLFVVNLVPAAVLTVLGVIALPLWKLVDLLVSWTMKLLPVDSLFVRALRWLGSMRASAVRDPVRSHLLGDERRKAAEAMWSEAVYPDLYREVPEDVVRPPFDDGRLIGGLRLHWLVDRYATEAALRSAVRVGVTTTLLAFIAFTIIYLLSAFGSLGDAFGQLKGSDAIQLEQWPGQKPTPVPSSWVWSAAFSVIGPTMLRTLGSLGTFLPGCAVACIGLGLLTLLLMMSTRHREKAAPYEWQSKDADVRWAFRTETRNLIRSTYAHQVRQATEHLKGQPTFPIGRGTGTLRARGDLTGPSPGQPLHLDQESLFQHLLVFGGTGDGKTTAVLKPLVRQFLRQPSYGLYVCDAKGVLWKDVLAITHQERPNAQIVTIGTGADQFGVDVLAGLTPTQVASTLRSVLTQISGGSSGESFWPDMAANVLRNVLSVAQAYSLTDKGKALLAEKKMSPYSLWWAYLAVLNADRIAEATAAIREFHASAQERGKALTPQSDQFRAFKAIYDRITSREVYDSIAYLEASWANMAKDTRSGIVANVTQMLDGFAGTPVLRERFAQGNPTNTISIAEALHGKIVLNALSSVEDGLPARIVMVLLKTNLYREARKREAAYRQGLTPTSPQSSPCIVLMDEVQELVTADVTSGLSDATFWNVARSTGVAGVFATQTVAALYQAIGREAATNFMQQARSKVFLRTEDRDTVEYACWCAGKFERNRVYDDGHRESIEYRALIDGWNPLEPVDLNEGIAGGWRVFFKAARALLDPERFAVGQAQTARAYSADTQYSEEMGNMQGSELAQIQSVQAAVWRAEDLERDYRKSGNEVADALTPADLIHMGRWHGFAQLQRAGAVRQDIIAVKHDFA
jgi:hypothetical protein